MNYTEAMNYINEAKKYGIVPGLLNMQNLCEYMGHPERELKIIHIAGTNGKGSTGAFIDSILRDAGYNVCRYVSPVLYEYEERFMYNGEICTKGDVAYYIGKIKEVIDTITSKGMKHPTPFEIETAMAFLYCRDKKCDYAILETGMGGRYDAVNVIEKSEVSVITSVGMDHMQFLGETIEDIAWQKAGIIKQNGVVVSALQDENVMDVIEQECKKTGARLIVADKVKEIRDNVFDYDDMNDICISLNGDFQIDNAAVAIEVCSELGISEHHIRSGLNHTVWKGRFEVICKSPLFIVDGAHNEDAAKKLASTIENKFKDRKINYIIGVLADKEYEKIIEHTAKYAKMIYTITPDNERALLNTKLLETVKKYNDRVKAVSLNEAVGECMKDVENVTIAFGSLSYLGEVMRMVENGKMSENL